jgi:hypothetical protein
MGRSVCALLFLFGCGRETAVILGDNLSTSPTFNKSYAGLLAENDDALFPDFAGRSLGEVVQLGRGGNSFRSTARSNEPPDLESHHPDVVIVELGSNDLMGVFLRMVRSETLRADFSPEMDEIRTDARAVFATMPGGARVFVTNVYDPTDGQGDVAELASKLIPPGLGIDVSVLTPELTLAVIAEGNRIIEEEAAAIGADVVDIRAHFLGHGFHASGDDKWMRGIFDPTLRGAHELRRVLWRSITGEDITAIPVGLPPDAIVGLPPIPDDGWAKAVARAEITQEIHSDETDLTYPNTEADIETILGPPNGGEDILALGVLGAYVIADLGETTFAADGVGPDLAVVEFGSLSGGTPEPYRVSVSDDLDGPFTIIADGAGEQAFDLADVGLARARYVKVESLASEVDVLNGLGSPIAPGPEIDAIGAVHPGAP